MLQESPSSHNFPHVSSFGGNSGYDHQMLPSHMQGYCSSKSSDIASPTHSMHTPQSKKKVSADTALQQQQSQQYPFSSSLQQPHRSGMSSGGSGGKSSHQSKEYGIGGDGLYFITFLDLFH